MKFGCGYYRMFLPSVSLCKMGIPAHIMSFDRIQLYNMADTLVIQRPAEAGLVSLVDEAHANGLKVVYELDDNLWDIPKWNQAYPFWTNVRLDTTESIMNKCDKVVTTTPYLAKVLKQFNANVLVVPNAILTRDYIEMPKQLKYDSKIIIGWVGSSFHQKDTEIFNMLIPMVLDKYPNVGFLMMGEAPPRSLSSYFHRILSLPFVEPIYYHTILASFNIHIGLAPLVINEFNKSKSPIKLIEYLYTNTFPICSEIEPYMQMKKEKDDCCMLIPTSTEQAGSVDDWMSAIDYCINNIEKVTASAQAAKEELVINKYNIESKYMRDLYLKAYYLEDSLIVSEEENTTFLPDIVPEPANLEIPNTIIKNEIVTEIGKGV